MSSPTPGIVYLVGGGPGDPGLLTLRGLACLRRADVVVFDRLIGRELLAHAPAQAELIDVGKESDRHPVPQDRINGLLVDRAVAGKVVVRLKGGDPFVFGRGGEEAEALVAAGIPFEIVPGVTSAIAAPAYAGIPVTHRTVACSAAIITGHRSESGQAEECSWLSAAGADTLVLLMGVANLPRIVAQLVAAGRPAETPVAVIQRGTFADQRVVVGTLADIADRVVTEGIRSPATIVVGEVVRLRERLRWFDRPDRRPLAGLRVLNTRPRHEAAELTARLAALGAEVVELPCMEMAPPDFGPLDAVLQRLAAFDWLVFTSVNTVTFTLDRLFALGYDARALGGVRLAAVGPATAQALHSYGLRADFTPSRFTAADLATEMGDVAGARVLLPRSNLIPPAPLPSQGRGEMLPLLSLRRGEKGDGGMREVRPDLADALNARGAIVETVIAYTVRPATAEPGALAALLGGQIQVVTFASPSALDGLATLLGDRTLADVLTPLCVACIGPTTADAARDLGVRVDLTPEEHTVAGMVDELVRWRQGK
ncbi:MAG: uroporphyrinogen-III C-methyltransferase [Chloroflexi bacterium]|nr:uroporphyrinogen-III C-methyltransferase [Chloroflexota bacterium]